jgi:ABC-type branched-subunit amino acid transport system substrate-binding protein
MIADMSGNFAGLSGPAANGGQAAFTKINDDGGVNGHPVKFTVFDTLSTTAGAQTAAQQAIASKPDVIFLAVLSNEGAALAPTLAATNIPAVFGTTISALADPSTLAAWAFSMGSFTPQIALAYTEEAKQLLGGSLQGKKIATEAIAAAASVAVMNITTALLKQEGATIVQQEQVPTTGFTSFASQATNIAGAQPDLVITSDQSADIVIVVPALRTAGYTGPVIGGEASADDALFQKLADPGFASGRIYNTPQPGDVMTTTAAKANVPTTGTMFGEGWAQAYAIAAAMKSCGVPCQLAAFSTNMEKVSGSSIPGNPAPKAIAFGPTKHYAPTAQVFVHWDKDQQKVVAAGPAVDTTDISGVPAAS